MATRSAIGYVRPNGSIRATYCHWDGSPEHQLPILRTHYNTVRKARALIRPGSMSQLRTTNTWESEYQRDPETGRANFDLPQTHQRPAQPLYHHERGHGPWCAAGTDYAIPPQVSATLPAARFLWAGYDCEWLFLYQPGCGWHPHKIG